MYSENIFGLCQLTILCVNQLFYVAMNYFML